MQRAFAWTLLAVFAAAMALFGGSSRPDVAQLGALRPIAALALIPALYLLTSARFRLTRLPALLLAALASWMALQLVPLPPTIWQFLPDRDMLISGESSAMSVEVWRSISMVPARGINALTSLLVPVAALSLAIALKLSLRDILLLIVTIGSAHAILGFLQLLSGSNSPLYLYSITSRGRAVGLFANENHAGIFSAVVMLAAARLYFDKSGLRGGAWLKIASGAAFMLALMSVIISGSRAGVVAGLFALGACIVMTYLFASRGGLKTESRGSAHRSSQPKVVRIGRFESRLLADPKKLATIGIVLILSFAIMFVLSGRAAGLEELLAADTFGDLRWELLPILQTMIGTHWLWGTGFGSFEEVYHIYEPSELLLPYYVNQAHNDWAQLIIEGGLPAVIILAVLLGWIVKSILAVARSTEYGSASALFWVAIFGAIMAASVPDYPLRTPIFQVVGVWLILGLAKQVAEGQAAR